MKDLEERIEEYNKSLGIAWAKMDSSTFQPFDFAEIDPLFAKEWISWLFEAINKAREVNISQKEMGPLLHCPSKIRSGCLLFEPFICKVGKFEKEVALEIFDFFSRILEAWCLEDPYATEGKNIIHQKEEIEGFIKDFKKADNELAKSFGKISNVCYNFSHGLYSDMQPDLVYENYGPYDVSDEYGPGHILVIKEYKNLRPVELWDGMEDLGFEKITLYCVYKDVKFSVDPVSHTIFEGDVINGLKFANIKVDGKEFDFENIQKELVDILTDKAVTTWQKLTEMSFEDKKEKYINQKAYIYKNFRERLGLNWKPNKDIFEAVKEKDLIKWPDGASEVPQFWVDMDDPRISWEDIKKKYPNFIPEALA